ncbi:MAG TPA: hypothetical protein VLH41_03430, partial [Thermoanaerobaculia bacterium]|nr:hypothetical protein [Thermoanaerobaculia bacterium]
SGDPPEKVEARRYFTDLYIHPPAPPSTEAGHHRFVWDLRYPRPRADRYDYMISAIAGEDTPVAPRGPLAVPGRYTVRLIVDGATQEQPLVVTPDPRVKAAPEVLVERLAFEKTVVAAMGESYDALVRVRALHKKLSGKTAERARTLEAGKPPSTGLAGVNALLATLLEGVDGSDDAPTSTQKEAYARTRANLDRLVSEWKSLEAEARARGIAVNDLDLDAPDSSERAGVEIE